MGIHVTSIRKGKKVTQERYAVFTLRRLLHLLVDLSTALRQQKSGPEWSSQWVRAPRGSHGGWLRKQQVVTEQRGRSRQDWGLACMPAPVAPLRKNVIYTILNEEIFREAFNHHFVIWKNSSLLHLTAYVVHLLIYCGVSLSYLMYINCICVLLDVCT